MGLGADGPPGCATLERPFLGVFLGLLLLLAAPLAWGQSYQTMASAPDPSDFVKHTDTGLTLLGAPLRFGGADISWLGLRRDGSAERRPTAYEVKDALQTAQVMGATVIRSVTLLGDAGCPQCLEPKVGHFSDEAFAALDQTIMTAGNMGLKLILPLAGSGDCAAHPDSAFCAYAGGDAKKFFGDPAIRTAFIARIDTILDHVNSLTGVPYRNDPAILAWENCDACGETSDPALVSGWTEAIGQAIKAEDHLHLYENGAFAGHILPKAAQPVNASAFAPPSVDIVGDHGLPPGDTAAIRATVAEATAAVTDAGRVYVVDDFDWGPATWQTQPALAAFLDALTRRRTLSGALFGGLQSHADTGGYLPPLPATAAGAPPLYFPGLAVSGIAADDMEQRARAVRRFDFAMSDILLAPAFPLPPKPEMISAANGRLVWRGAAGALNYTVERTADPRLPENWQTLCEQCATDSKGFWQDPSPPKEQAWYRVMPFNANSHKSRPSDPMANR